MSRRSGRPHRGVVETLEARALLTGTTGTGLDQLVALIENDAGLRRRIPAAEIQAGALAADQLNHLIVDAIRADGLANDGVINVADVRDFSRFIKRTASTQWTTLYGTDSGGVETGFQLVRGDGATSSLFSRNAVDSIADGIFHLGFGDSGSKLLDPYGNATTSIESVTSWINQLLTADLAAGRLANTAKNPYVVGTTGTGLDQLVTIITTDPGLARSIPTTQIMAGAGYANQLNGLIIESIKADGLANDNTISPSDLRDFNRYLREHYQELWVQLHGDDEDDGSETGFHKVQNNGATTTLYGRNAVNTVADGIYHLGFEICGTNFLNEDGNSNASLDSVSSWLNQLLAADLAAGRLANTAKNPYVVGTTGTGLDQAVTLINSDAGLGRKLATSRIQAGASAADQMNRILVAAIRATGVARDHTLTADDLRVVNTFIRTNHGSEWATLFGTDANGVQTGFQLVSKRGATGSFSGVNAVDSVLRNVYMLGFTLRGSRVGDPAGNAGANLDQVASWLSQLLAADLASGALG